LIFASPYLARVEKKDGRETGSVYYNMPARGEYTSGL